MMAIHVLPQGHCRFHVDEAGVFAELPVHVIGDPPLPVISIDHFSGIKDTGRLMSEKPGSNEGKDNSQRNGGWITQTNLCLWGWEKSSFRSDSNVHFYAWEKIVFLMSKALLYMGDNIFPFIALFHLCTCLMLYPILYVIIHHSNISLYTLYGYLICL